MERIAESTGEENKSERPASCGKLKKNTSSRLFIQRLVSAEKEYLRILSCCDSVSQEIDENQVSESIEQMNSNV